MDLTASLSQAKSVLLVLPQNPSFDTAAAGLGLYLSFKNSGKSASIVSPVPPTASLSRLVGVNEIAQEIGNKNLIISFSVPEEAIEKVSYNYDNNRLNFVVEPAQGFTAPTSNQVNFSYSGLDADLVIVLGSDLGKFGQNEDLANHSNRHTLEAGPSGLSASAAQLVLNNNLPLDPDSGGNLMAGIDYATRNLSQNVTPEVLEVAATLLRSGASRYSQVDIDQKREEKPSFMPRDREQRFRPRRDRRFPQGQRPQGPAAAPSPQPQAPPQPQNQPQEQVSPEDTDAEVPTPEPDWFEPKIYKGSSLL